MRHDKLYFSSALALLALSQPLAAAAKPKQPNILFILADDMSYRDLSCYGQRRYQTPNIDALARGGVRFTQAYASAPESAPSRCGLLTGQHTGHASVRMNSSARGQDHIMDGDITVAEVLRDSGYSTAFIGKWGIGIQGTEGVPYKQGFDYSFGFYDQTEAHTYLPDYLYEGEKKILYPENSGYDMKRRYDYKGNKAQNSYDEKGRLFVPELKDPYGYRYSENEMQQRAMKFLKEQNSNKSFFLYYATQLPHGPVMVDDIGEMAKPASVNQLSREWGAMVIKLDRFVGELVAELKRSGEYENTIIFFASDNGYSMCGYTERGNGPKWLDDPWLENKGPFSGGKFTVQEGGLRVPLFVHYPREFSPAVVSTPVWLPDFFPTAAEIAGVKRRNVPHNDGESLLPLLMGETPNVERHFYFSKGREQAVRLGAFSAYRANMESKVKLYLIEEDSFAERDLAAIYPDVVRQAEQIMNNSFEPHPWYWNPNETPEEYRAKVKRAQETDNILPIYRPNGIEQFPWEHKKN